MSDDTFVPIPETMRYDWFLSDGEVAGENRMHFRHLTGMYTPLQAYSFATALYNFCAMTIMPLLSSDATLEFVIGLQQEVPFAAPYDYHPITGVSGGMGAGMPACLAARVDFRTGLDGKWYNGRNYVPWIPREVVMKSHIDPAWLEAVRIAYTELLSYAEAYEWEWVVPSRRFGGLPRTTGITTPITYVAIPDNRIRTWRQRIARYGT